MMTKITKLVPRAKSAGLSSKSSKPGEAAKIVIFPGVRYERAGVDTSSQLDVDKTAVRPASLALMDREGA